MTRRGWLGLWLVAAPPGELRRTWRGSELVVRTEPGGIRSLVWRGREFLNAFDASRYLQCAATLGRGPARERRAEADANGALVARDFRILPQALEVSAVFQDRASEAVYEVPSAAAPPEFSTYLIYDPAGKKLQSLSDGPGEGDTPIILATPDRQFAMGVFGGSGATYARQRYNAKPDLPNWNFVQWRCLYRPAKGNQKRFRTLLVPGTVPEVTAIFDRLYQERRQHANQPV